MRVLIDATNLKPGQTGIRSYTLELVKALSRRSDVTVSVITSDPEAFECLAIDVVVAPTRTRGFIARCAWREATLRRITRRVRPDVLLFNAPEAPMRRVPCPSAVVLHDVGALVAPALYGWKAWLRWRVDLSRVVSRVDHVLSVSRTSLREANAAIGLPTERCTVIGSGAQSLGYRAWSADRDEPYVLYAGTAFRHKNLSTLVKAFGADRIGNLSLVVTGPVCESEVSDLRRAARAVGADDHIEWRGFIPRDELEALLAGATALAFPTLHEGFGMPVVEAMRAGVPVVASDIPALREAAGDAALFVESPLDPSAWATALAQVASDPGAASELSTRGRAKAETYSWDSVAELTVGALSRVAFGTRLDRDAIRAKDRTMPGPRAASSVLPD